MTEDTFKISQMNLNEFIADGYLQEANRLYFHPLGLSLVVVVDEDVERGDQPTLIVLDGRDNPLGFRFDDLSEEDSLEKANYIATQQAKCALARAEAYGWVFQPLVMEGRQHAESNS